MLFAICVITLLGVLGGLVWLRRNRYWLVETKTAGTVRSRIVRLPLQHIDNKKLRHEIKIFNRMYLVLPVVHGVAVAYREQLRTLLRNPKTKPSADPYERLLYGYACYVLMHKVGDEVVRRQLRHNLLFLLAPKRKIVKRQNVTWVRCQYQFHSVPVYKIFRDCYLDPLQPGITLPEPWQMVVHGSYIKYYNDHMVVKRYAHAYELSATETQTITLKVANDKTDFDCQISRGVVTCRHLPSGESHTYAVRGDNVRLATSMCAKVDALEIYITWQGDAKICLDGGQPHWLTCAEVTDNQRLEHLVNTAYQSQFIMGERLRTRYLTAVKLVPSLHGLTRVVAVRSVDDFWRVWNALEDYRYVARLFRGFSLVFLYSGAVGDVANVMLANLTQEQIMVCQQDNLWIYLIDSTVTEPDAWYILNKMARSNHYVAPAQTPVGLSVSRTWPYTKTLTVTNNLPRTVTQNVSIPLRFNRLSVVTAVGTILTVVGLVSGRVNTYVLPVPVHIAGEWMTTHVNIPLKIKLAGYETRQFVIMRRENQSKDRLTKKDLMTALSEIQIRTDDKKFDALFNKPVIDGEDSGVLTAVKAAYQNQSRKLLLAALGERNQITMDVWQYLLTQVVGIRVRVGKIYLAPCMNIMGEFTLSFLCEGQRYCFNTKKNLPTSDRFATIKYGNTNG